MIFAPSRRPQKLFAANQHPTQSMLADAPFFAHCHPERSEGSAVCRRSHYRQPRPTLIAIAVLLFAFPQISHAQSQPKAQQAIEAAVQSELAASREDKSAWRYRDHDVSPEENATYYTIETPKGELKRLIELNGRPLDEAARDRESNRIADYVEDPSAQAKARKAGAHDDAQAEEMTKMLPRAFIWSVASENSDYITLDYHPNPAFDPPDYEARVMSAMAGQVVIAKSGNRMRSLKGALTQDVKFGYGLFGRLKQGGTFDIERRQIAPGHWQITESHVHIGGRALLFKNIGQQDDEVKTDWKPSTANNLHDAEDQLRDAR